MSQPFHSKKISDTKAYAQKIASIIKPGDILAISGQLGAGKTTFVSFLANALGTLQTTSSPTYSICKHYKLTNGAFLNHLDLYRVNTLQGLHDLGINDLFSNSQDYTVIEWPEIASQTLPDKTINLDISLNPDASRNFTLKTNKNDDSRH